jgi:hypothetical protein
MSEGKWQDEAQPATAMTHSSTIELPLSLRTRPEIVVNDVLFGVETGRALVAADCLRHGETRVQLEYPHRWTRRRGDIGFADSSRPVVTSRCRDEAPRSAEAHDQDMNLPSLAVPCP